MATVPSPDPMPDTGPVDSPPQPTTPPSELPQTPGDIDQPAAMGDPAPPANAQQEA